MPSTRYSVPSLFSTNRAEVKPHESPLGIRKIATCLSGRFRHSSTNVGIAVLISTASCGFSEDRSLRSCAGPQLLLANLTRFANAFNDFGFRRQRTAEAPYSPSCSTFFALCSNLLHWALRPSVLAAFLEWSFGCARLCGFARFQFARRSRFVNRLFLGNQVCNFLCFKPNW